VVHHGVHKTLGLVSTWYLSALICAKIFLRVENHAAMPLFDSYTARRRVNILKKVKVQEKWKLCPAVVEPNGKLKDRVRVNGKIETHPEGIYFLEWRDEQKRRRRILVPDRIEVINRARIKSLELEGIAATVVTPAASQWGSRLR
jgi:hypothetical protein